MAITQKTRKLLWGSSGNRCAICKRKFVIDGAPKSQPSLVGDECHIVSGRRKGPRADPTFPADRIHRVDNLVLLCKIHHKMVDDQPENYPADCLRLIKAEHEAWVDSSLEVAQERSDGQFAHGAVSYRQTFVGYAEFFASKAPRSSNPILDFSRTMYGRASHVESLHRFLSSAEESICIFSGRGGVGKSKLLHDWGAALKEWSVVFLKDKPVWDADSVKEIPSGQVVIVVDDAHRASLLPEVLQLLAELRLHQPIKLVLSTRPGGVLQLEKLAYRAFDSTEVLRLPDLEELSRDQAEALAREVLGENFSIHARDLAHVSNNSPLVIVAGGNLIAARHILPAELSGIEDFRLKVFSRFYDELELSGPKFAIDPPGKLLQVIAAIGPMDATSEPVLEAVRTFLGSTIQDVEATLEQLAAYGVVTPRTEPVRIVPDVLSDYVLETACVGSSGLSTGYADLVFKVFGDAFFAHLMQNLSELDWRLGRVGRGLDLLGSVWNRVFGMFREADTHRRRKLLQDLRPAAVYQPAETLELVRLARIEPLVEGNIPRIYQVGRSHLLEVLPVLLEATAYHVEYRTRAVDILWELAAEEDKVKTGGASAKGTLERMASYQRYKVADFNFSMLLQAVRLSKRHDAFEADFSPLNLVDAVLEREGEFEEYLGHAFSFGGFGLNYPAVADLRDNAIDFVNSLLYSEDCVVANRAIASLRCLLPNVMNRVGRVSEPNEIAWQQKERLKALSLLIQRLQVLPLSLVVRRQTIHAIRSGTAVSCSTEVRERAGAEISRVDWDLDLLLLDAVCCREGDFPITNKVDLVGSYQAQSQRQLEELAIALHRRYPTVQEKAQALVEKVKLAYQCRIEPNGFERVLRFYREDGALIAALVERLMVDEDSLKLNRELSAALFSLHIVRPQAFHELARAILARGELHQVLAAANALQVDAHNVGAADLEVIEEYLTFSDSRVRCLCLHHIAFLGQKPEFQSRLVHAVMAVEVKGDPEVAVALVEAFGPYGVRIEQLSEAEVEHILAQLAPVEDFSAHQGRIPTFLSCLTSRFPNRILQFVLDRVDTEQERRSRGDWSYRAFDSSYGHVSFASVTTDDKVQLVRTCLDRYLRAESFADLYRDLFWTVLGGLDDESLSVLSDSVVNGDSQRVSKIIDLIRTSPGRLVLGNDGFVKRFLRNLSGEMKSAAVAAFVDNAYSLGNWGGAGDPNQMIENNYKQIASALPKFQDDPDVRELYIALASAEPPKYPFGSHFGLQPE
ncbi:MAG: HNH endonuclease signature motif containing protein [Terracidiphilus sp.]